MGGGGQKKGEKVTQAGMVVYVSLCQGEDFFFYWCSFRQTDSAMVQYYLFAERFAFWLIVCIKRSTAFTIKHSTGQSNKELKNHSKVKCRNVTQYVCIHTHTHMHAYTHTHTCTHTHTHTCTHTRTHTHARIHTHTHARIHTHTHARIRTHTPNWSLNFSLVWVEACDNKSSNA